MTFLAATAWLEHLQGHVPRCKHTRCMSTESVHLLTMTMRTRVARSTRLAGADSDGCCVATALPLPMPLLLLARALDSASVQSFWVDRGVPSGVAFSSSRAVCPGARGVSRVGAPPELLRLLFSLEVCSRWRSVSPRIGGRCVAVRIVAPITAGVDGAAGRGLRSGFEDRCGDVGSGTTGHGTGRLRELRERNTVAAVACLGDGAV